MKIKKGVDLRGKKKKGTKKGTDLFFID